MFFEDWKKETFPKGCIVTAMYGTGLNIERPLKSAYDAGYTEGCKAANFKKDTIIEFLKKELIHKTCYRQTMKRQYRELKQKYDSIMPKERLLKPSLTSIAEFSVLGWTEQEKQELFDKWKEINKRKNK